MNNQVLTAPRAHGGTVTKEKEQKASDFTMMRISKDLVRDIRIAAAYEEKSMVMWLDSVVREALKKQGQKKK